MYYFISWKICDGNTLIFSNINNTNLDVRLDKNLKITIIDNGYFFLIKTYINVNETFWLDIVVNHCY